MDFRNRRWFRVGFPPCGDSCHRHERSLVLTVVFLLLMSQVVLSQSATDSAENVGFFASILKFVRDIGKIMSHGVEWVLEQIGKWVQQAINFFFNSMKDLLTMNPKVYGPDAEPIVQTIVPTVMSIIQPFYVMLAILTGMYFIFAAMDPKRRSAAKNMLMKLIVGMVITGLSMPIYQFTLDLSASLTKLVFLQAFGQIAEEQTLGIMGTVVVVSVMIYPPLVSQVFQMGLFILTVVLVVMALRYVAVIIFAILFPAALFLYFFDSTKGLGGSILYQALTWIFVPVVQALMIVITIFALQGMVPGFVMDVAALEGVMNNLANATLTLVMSFFMVMAGLVGVVIAPLIMMSVLKWVGGAMAGYGMLKIPQAQTKLEFWQATGITALGETMMGGFSRGLPGAATEAAYMSEYTPMFGMSASWRDVFPSMGEVRSWLGGQGGGTTTVSGGPPPTGKFGTPTGGTPWVGAAARAREAEREKKGKRGLIADFFGTYRDALTYHTRHPQELVERYGAKKDEKKSGGRVLPLSPTTSLAGKGQDMMGQETTVSDDSSGARSVYMPKMEGMPFLSIPLYFLGGMWTDNLSKRGKDIGNCFAEGKVAKGIGISLFETFKMFSPFRPIRHLGRILYTAIPEFVPPVPFPVPFIGWNLRDVAWWGSRKMCGIGFGQMASRTSWRMQLGMAESEFIDARKRFEKAGKTPGSPEEQEMNAAADKYVEILKGIRDGSGIRMMRDPDFYNKKREELFIHNPDLHFAVNCRMEDKPGDIGDYGVLDAAKRIKKVVDAGESPPDQRKRLAFDLNKGVDAAKDADKTKKQEEMNMTLLLFDYLQHKPMTVDQFVNESLRERNILDFMNINGAREFGIGVKHKGDEKGAWSDDTKAVYNIQEMEGYVDMHKTVTGRDLVVKNKEGKYARAYYRVMAGASLGCANQNEVMRLPDGTVLTNIQLVDAVKDGRVYSFVDQNGSLYAERVKGFETGGGLGGFWGRGDERAEQWLDAGSYDINPRTGDYVLSPTTGKRVFNHTGAGFVDGFSYRQVGQGNFVVHYKGKAVVDLWGEDLDEVARLTGVSAQKIKNNELDKNDVLLTAEKNPMAFRKSVETLTRVGFPTGGINRAGADALLGRFDSGRLIAGDEENIAEIKKLAHDGARRQAIAADTSYMTTYVRGKYVPTTTLGEYKTRLTEANKHIYFNGQMVSDLRNAGYSDEDIDHLKLTLAENPRYRELTGPTRGENIDVRIANDPNNHEVAWMRTDKAGRRTLTLNVAGEKGEEMLDAEEKCAKLERRLRDLGLKGKRRERIDEMLKDADGNPAALTLMFKTETPDERACILDLQAARGDRETLYETAKNDYMNHLEKGDILGHETTHDKIREHYKDASYTEIWRDFLKGNTKMNNVFIQTGVDRIKGEIARELRIDSILSDEKAVRLRLKTWWGLTEEDMGRMLCEGLADVGGKKGSTDMNVYDDSIHDFIDGKTRRLQEEVDLEKRAGVTPGDDSMSRVSRDEVSTLARMHSLSTQTDYVSDILLRGNLRQSVEDVRVELGAKSRVQYSRMLAVYEAIHSNKDALL